MATIKKTKTAKKKVMKKKVNASVSAKKKAWGKTGAASVRSSEKTAKKPKLAKPAAAKKAAAKKVAAKKIEVPAKKVAEKKAGGEKDRLQELRKTLIKKREAIIKEAKEEIAKYISGESRQLVDTALDEGDWAVVDISEDMNLSRLSAHRKTLHDIDESLRKISEGSYGICEECGEEISEKRLSVLPTATLCLSCQENKEQREAIEKEEVI
jgi:DnaK suppressor protein